MLQSLGPCSPRPLPHAATGKYRVRKMEKAGENPLQAVYSEQAESYRGLGAALGGGRDGARGHVWAVLRRCPHPHVFSEHPSAFLPNTGPLVFRLIIQ